MAIYHCSMKAISRRAGQSIIAAAAYRHACKLQDARTGEIHDYSRKRGVESSGIYLPSGVNPAWAQDRAQLWNTAEAAEKRKDARLGRELVLALCVELTSEQRRELAGEMARYLADHYGLAVDVAIHQPSRHGDERNYHAHILMSSRRITPEGFGEKARELDDHERGPIEVEHIRAQWARLANRALERAGQDIQIDHRSFEAQGINFMPTIHMGPSASAMERRGVQTRIGNRNRAARTLNSEVKKLKQELVTDQGRLTEEELFDGMAAFKAGYVAHKQEEAERKRKLEEEQEKTKKRLELAEERLKILNRSLSASKIASNPEMAFAGHYKTWLEERREDTSLTLTQMQSADWIVACRMLSQGHDPEILKKILHKCSPAAALEVRNILDSSALVNRALQQPEVQRKRKEALEKQEEQERNWSQSGPSMGR